MKLKKIDEGFELIQESVRQLERVFFVKNGQRYDLWDSYSPNHGVHLPFQKDLRNYFTSKRGDSNYDDSVNNLAKFLEYQISDYRKEKNGTVSRLYKIPVYDAMKDFYDAEIYYSHRVTRDDTNYEMIEPIDNFYVLVSDLVDAEYKIINVFKTKRLAQAFID